MIKKKNILISLYKEKVTKNEIKYDEKQIIIIKKFQYFYNLITKKHNLLNYILNFFSKKNEKNGIYLWGSVGSGKTYLMDLFYNTLPIKEKKRMHFHTLMLYIHNELKKFSSDKNPIKKLSKCFIKNMKTLCIDELYIEDITDAMLIKSFFSELFKKKIVLIITSNIPQNELYKNGLQRQHFIEIIKKIETYLYIVNLNNNIDYRQLKQQKKKIFYSPLTINNLKQCIKLYIQLSKSNIKTIKNYIIINNRKIKTVYITKKSIWFDYKEICCTPRNNNDYITISEKFNLIVISNIYTLKENNYQSAKRFIALIDELYEKGVKVIILSEVPINCLNSTNKLNLEFKRLISRTVEMQTANYLNKQHQYII